VRRGGHTHVRAIFTIKVSSIVRFLELSFSRSLHCVARQQQQQFDGSSVKDKRQ
jgi:hypothetical protein